MPIRWETGRILMGNQALRSCKLALQRVSQDPHPRSFVQDRGSCSDGFTGKRPDHAIESDAASSLSWRPPSVLDVDGDAAQRLRDRVGNGIAPLPTSMAPPRPRPDVIPTGSTFRHAGAGQRCGCARVGPL